MKRIALVLVLVSLLFFTIVAVTLIFVLSEDEANKDELYTFPILVGEKTHTVWVCSNYSSAPEVSYFGLLKSVSVDFSGDRENAFCNITIPLDLIWGELSVYQHGYEMSGADYILSSNSTHNSVYFTFDLPALIKDFSIKGSEGVIP